jgi:hypothetical protein
MQFAISLRKSISSQRWEETKERLKAQKSFYSVILRVLRGLRLFYRGR